MKIIHYPDQKIENTPKALADLSQNDLFLDIETTGLSSKRNPIYLIGLGKYKAVSSSVSVSQFFAESREEEKSILSAFLDEIKNASALVTFNGNRFDLPYLRDRLLHYEMEPGLLEAIPKKDLYLDFRPARKYYNLPSLRQKAIEEFLGIRREDEKNGGELIPVYHAYERTRDPKLGHLLLLHNKNDVEDMIPLFQMYDYLPSERLSAPLSIHKISREGPDTILFFGRSFLLLPSEVRYREDSLLLSLDQGQVKGAVFPKQKDLVFALPDYKSYVFLPEENRILPKVLAESLPKGRYRKARKDECIEHVSGFFLPLLPGMSSPGGISSDELFDRIYFEETAPKKQYIRIPETPQDLESPENSEESMAKCRIQNYLNLYLLSRFR